MHAEVWSDNMKENYPLGDPSVDGAIILKRILETYSLKARTGLNNFVPWQTRQWNFLIVNNFVNTQQNIS